MKNLLIPKIHLIDKIMLHKLRVYIKNIFLGGVWPNDA